MSTVRTRFAPSPTGALHVGGARTALYSYIFAKAHQGQFILRIEDTDQERSRDHFTQDILQALEWLGVRWDEGPFFQSQRLDIYHNFREQLLQKNLAYEKDGAIYLKVPPDISIHFKDIIRGSISTNTKEINDFVIFKQDGFPTFHFAVVIDDATMNISHIIRGEDHISNTPKQLLIYQALDLPIPQYAHLPLIVGPDHAPLSKRHGATALSDYSRQGYLPEALFNFLARIGWGYQNQEIFSLADLIRLFDLKKVSKSPGVFDLTKLNWLNAQYLKKSSPEEIYTKLQHKTQLSLETLTPLIELMRPKLQHPDDIIHAAQYVFTDSYDLSEDALTLLKSNHETSSHLGSMRQTLSTLDDWSCPAIEGTIRSLAEELDIKAAQLIHPLRAILTGQKVTPGLFELMEIMGKNTVLSRISNSPAINS